MVTTKSMTAEEFMALPDDGRRYELIEGVLHEVSPGGLEHSGIGIELIWYLSGFVREHDLGRVYGPDAGYYFERDPVTVRAPDVSFIRTDRLPASKERKGFSPVLPDLAVEIASPGDSPGEIAEKVAFYLDHGVPLVWMTYPQSQSVVAHRSGREPRVFGPSDVLDGEDVVPGFRLPVADLFR
jgi:Uma2 family endonuclease